MKSSQNHIVKWEKLIWVAPLPGFPFSASLVAQSVKCGRLGFSPWVRKILWRRKWQPIPVILPGEFHGQRSLAYCSPWGRKELHMTERLSTAQHKNAKFRNSWHLLAFLFIIYVGIGQYLELAKDSLSKRFVNILKLTLWMVTCRNCLDLPRLEFCIPIHPVTPIQKVNNSNNLKQLLAIYLVSWCYLKRVFYL